MAKYKIHWYYGCRRRRAFSTDIATKQFLSDSAKSPDWYCVTCVKAARLALAKEQPIAVSFSSTVRRCFRCRSGAINPSDHGRTEGADLDLCDVCYWRKRAESATWPKPRPISEAPKDGSMVLICLPDTKPQWTMGVFARTHWVDLCLATAIVDPTHFLPLPPEVR